MSQSHNEKSLGAVCLKRSFISEAVCDCDNLEFSPGIWGFGGVAVDFFSNFKFEEINGQGLDFLGDFSRAANVTLASILGFLIVPGRVDSSVYVFVDFLNSGWHFVDHFSQSGLIDFPVGLSNPPNKLFDVFWPWFCINRFA